ncbi:MAG: isoleucine--tRNA ligase, partial [Planctomycetota bacterium]
MAFREDLKPDRILAVEEEILAAWREEGTFQATLDRRRGAPPWIFYEGPPTANGRPGVHHVLARAVKDFACRLKTMQGFYVERRAGWDTQGLPVEIETERHLGLEGKQAIEAYGIDRFNEACRASVFRYLEDWTALTRRMGYWVDLDHPYVTCERDYIESLWWILARFHERGILVRGHKVLPYCPRCSTPLPSHEVGQGFKDVQDPSVTVLLDLEEGDGALLVWTTTPWTLPANLAVAVNPDVDYAEVEALEGEHRGRRLWPAEARPPVLKVAHEVRRTVSGRELVGRRYRRLLDWYPVDERAPSFTVIAADFVTTEDGTGFVHVAPAYGQDDNDLGKRVGLPVLHPVDRAGCFRPGSPVEGRFVKDADKDILRILGENGTLWERSTVEHSYPHCWRCSTPLLYYACESWFLTTTTFKDEMLAGNDQVRWHPESVGAGRFRQWLEGNIDWALSRDRYWGTPIPVWVCEGCGLEEAVGSLAELERRAGRTVEDPHRPYVDELTWPCSHEGCDGTMRRTPEVADAWFDSGSMPFAQWHYPFENAEKVEREHPADFIAEAVDQTRGWFYTLLAVSTMLTGKPAYKTCVSLGHILDAKGKKMSKSRGNAVDPFEMMEKFGADVVRWHLLVRPLGTPLRYDPKDLVEIRNRFFGTLLNVYAFFATYANIDGYRGDDAVPLETRPVFDRWLVSRLHSLFRDVSRDVEAYDTAHAGQRIADFVVEDLSNWYVRRNRRRFFRAEMTGDKRSGYQTLHAALLSVVQLAAPFSPFLTDALYRSLSDDLEGAEPSVHLASWPQADEALIDAPLEEGMAALRRVVSLGHAARDQAGIRVRQPLAAIRVWGLVPVARDFVRDNAAIALDELNVKSIDFLDRPDEGVRLSAELDKKEAARRLGAKTPAVMKALAALGSDEVAALLGRTAIVL